MSFLPSSRGPVAMGGMVSGLLIGVVVGGFVSTAGGRRIGDVGEVKFGRLMTGSRSSVSGRIGGRIAGRFAGRFRFISSGKSRLTSNKFKRNCKFSCRNSTIWASSLKSSSLYMETIQRKSFVVLDGPTVGIAAKESVIKAKLPAPG